MEPPDTLEYRPRTRERIGVVWRLLRAAYRFRLTLVISAFIGTAAIAWAMVPTTAERSTFICRTCGLEKNEWKNSVMGFRTSERTSFRTNFSDIYDTQVALPHTHDWIGDRYSVQTASCFSRSCGVGHVDYGRWPRSQIEVTQWALMSIEQFAALPTSYRQALYGRMLSCQTPDEVLEVVSEARREQRLAQRPNAPGRT